MPSINFEFLRKTADFAALADLGGLAEAYGRPDPVAAVVKLRTYGETLTQILYARFRLIKPIQANFNDLLVLHAFQELVPRAVLAHLHAIRKEGNRAAHGEKVDPSTALWLLRE